MQSLKDKADYINKWVHEVFPEEVWTYIKMSRDDLRKLTPTDLVEIAFILRGQALFLQAKSNKISACLKSHEHAMMTYIAPKLKDYDKYTKFDEKKALAIRENEALTRMDNEIIDLAQKKEALEFLTMRLENIVSSLNDLKRDRYDSRDNQTT